MAIVCTISLFMPYTSCNSEKRNSDKNTEVIDKTFDVNSIPISGQDLGEFPFFSLPERLAEQNNPVQRRFDRLFFPINGIMIRLEGKVWKTNVTMKSDITDEWSLPYFERSYDEAIKAVGGVKIFDGEITKEEYDRYHSQASYLGEDGSVGYGAKKPLVANDSEENKTKN